MKPSFTGVAAALALTLAACSGSQGSGTAIQDLMKARNLSEADVKDILDTSLVYTDYKETSDYIGAPGKPGKLYDIFNTVMELNLENGAATTKLDPAQQIDPAIIPGLF